MAYNPEGCQLTHLLQDAWYRLGQITSWIATNGSDTEIENTAWAGSDEEIYEDDDASIIFGSVVMTESGGVAPEGEIAKILDYDSGSFTLTHSGFTASIVAGNKFAIASPLFPYEDILNLTDISLRRLGKIDVVDYSLTTNGSQTEYTMPISVKPKRVRIQSQIVTGDSGFHTITGWDVIPASGGWTLVLPHLETGLLVELLYEDFHPRVTGYDSVIQPNIYPELALSALLAECYQWYNNKISGSNQYMLQRENKAIQDLEAAKGMYPIQKLDEQIQGLPHWRIH